MLAKLVKNGLSFHRNRDGDHGLNRFKNIEIGLLDLGGASSCPWDMIDVSARGHQRRLLDAFGILGPAAAEGPVQVAIDRDAHGLLGLGDVLEILLRPEANSFGSGK